MPELPEVETIRRRLEDQIVGKTIQSVEVGCERILQNISVEEFVSSLKNHTILDIGRYGKYLFFHIGPYTMISHLRMEGKYYFVSAVDPKGKYEHVRFDFTDGSSLRYEDMRKFGTMELVNAGTERKQKGICCLGPEPFDESFTMQYLKERIQRSRKPIKSVLLDQTVVCGLGNIYVNEVLFLCRIHPETPAWLLMDEQYEDLVKYCRLVLRDAIDFGGTTIRSYYSGLGVKGEFQGRLAVHGKNGVPCMVCGTTIEKIMVGGRGTYFCQKCQKGRDN